MRGDIWVINFCSENNYIIHPNSCFESTVVLSSYMCGFIVLNVYEIALRGSLRYRFSSWSDAEGNPLLYYTKEHESYLLVLKSILIGVLSVRSVLFCLD